MFLRKPVVVRLLWLLINPLSRLAVRGSDVRLHSSPSLPSGRYRRPAVASPVMRGTVMIVHVPGWSARTRPFLKPGARRARADELLRAGGRALVAAA
jgi:type IV secretory pathway protease TraF